MGTETDAEPGAAVWPPTRYRALVAAPRLVFQAALDNLVASIERNPRTVRVIYTNPVEEERLLAAGATVERTHRRWRPGREWAGRYRRSSICSALRPPDA